MLLYGLFVVVDDVVQSAFTLSSNCISVVFTTAFVLPFP